MRNCLELCFIVVFGISTTLVTPVVGRAQSENEQDFEITAEPSSVPIGGVAKLTWKAHGSAAFLSSVGQVRVSDSMEVTPQEPTTYTLVVDNGGKLITRSTKVSIEGVRDFPVGPDFEKYKAAVTGQAPALGYVQFLEFVFKTLRDKLNFDVHGDFLPDRPYSVLYTEPLPKPELVRQSDSGVRERKIAYAVLVFNSDGNAKPPCNFEVRVLIEYRLFGESKWHPEPTDSALMHEQSYALKQVLETSPAK